MKILVIADAFARADSEHLNPFIHEQVTLSVRQGCEIIVFCPTPWIPKWVSKLWRFESYPYYRRFITPFFEESDGVKIYRAKYIRPPGAWVRPLNVHLMRFFVGRTFRKIMHRFAPDLVHAHMTMPCGFLAQALLDRKQTAVPLFLTVHGDDVTQFSSMPPVLQHQIQKALRGADKVLCASDYLRRQIMDICPEMQNSEMQNCLTHYVGIDFARFQIHEALKAGIRKGVSEKAGGGANKAPAKGKTIGFIGRMGREKGILDLFAVATSDMVNSHKEAVKYVFVGEGSCLHELQLLAEARTDAERFVFMGAVAPREIPVLVKTFDLLVLPSHREGFGLVSLEAQAAGVPVIVADVGGLRETVPQETVFENADPFFPPHDVAALANKINAFLSDPAPFRQRVVAAQPMLEKKFDIRKQTAKLLALYKAAIDKT